MAKNGRDSTKPIYLHIPKSAGTTLHSIIDQQYPPANICSAYPAARHPFGDVEQFKALEKAERAEIDVLLGHVSFGIHEFRPGASLYITILPTD